MYDVWKPADGLRETSFEISGGYYTKAYVQKQGVEGKCKAWCYVPATSAWMPEFLEIAFDEAGKLVWRFSGDGRKPQQEKFLTSVGVFVSHNRGEFGGTLITPAKQYLSGNFVEVFECFEKIYAIDSCNHMGMGHVKIYEFLKDFRYREVFSSFEKTPAGESELICFKALCVQPQAVYLLVSGFTDKIFRQGGGANEDRAYLFEISEKGFVCKSAFPQNFELVQNMLVRDGKMILGMDKVIAEVDLDSAEITAYTPISIEAENDIRSGKKIALL